jgi:hypothetical protein
VEDGGFGPHLPPFDEVKVPYKNAVMVNHAIFKVELKKDNSTTLVFTRMDKDEQFLNDIFQEDDPYSKAISQDTLVLIRQAYAQKIPVHHNIKQFGSLMVISTVLPMIT